MSALEIRSMTAGDLQRTLDWAAAEGWNPGLQDAFCFATVDPEGLLMGFLDGEPVGSITVVNYDDTFAFLGLFIVRPEFRGRGHGRALWDVGMAHAGDRLVGLDGVVEQQLAYRRRGFAHAHRNVRYGGVLRGAHSTGVVPLDRAHLDEIDVLDQTLFPTARRSFLDGWLTAPGHIALGARTDGRLSGYGVLRPCRRGAKIGPLIAANLPMAEALLDGLVARWGGGEVFLDLPETNAAARDLAEARGMEPIFETARMYTGDAPRIAIDRVFGITTYELG